MQAIAFAIERRRIEADAVVLNHNHHVSALSKNAEEQFPGVRILRRVVQCFLDCEEQAAPDRKIEHARRKVGLNVEPAADMRGGKERLRILANVRSLSRGAEPIQDSCFPIRVHPRFNQISPDGFGSVTLP